MKSNRRDFIKQSAAMVAGMSIPGIAPSIAPGRKSSKPAEMIKDGGMHFSEAYFDGMEERKIALCKQMDVLGAVGRLDPRMVGMEGANPWDYEVIKAIKEAWDNVGLTFRVVEGDFTLGTQTKLGLEGRDEEIKNFITLVKNLGRAGVNIVCYNWMAITCCERTDIAKPGRGGALVTEFVYNELENEPINRYGELSQEGQWKNLEYFLNAVIPEAEKAGVKLAMHPDDPQIEAVNSVPRIMGTAKAFDRMLDIYPSSSNGITMCQANFSLMGEDIPSLVHHYGDNIHFVHFRNIRGSKYKFEEPFHDEGQINMYEALKAYYDTGFRGPIRPDHVPTMAGDSNERPGYSKLGAIFAFGYMRGLMHGIPKNAQAG